MIPLIRDNKIIKLFKKRSEQYSENTEEIVMVFYEKLKWAISRVFLDNKDFDLIINDVAINEKNYHFLNISGIGVVHKVGEEVPDPEDENKTVKITSGNLLDFASSILIVLPLELLTDGTELEVYDYILKLKEILENESN